jgi:putative endonuclease
MFFVYILQSVASGRYYIGYSEFPERRLTEHNSGKVKSTRIFRPWMKVYTESFPSQAEAMRREKSIKAMKSRSYIQKLIGKTRPD